jgi:2-oxoglutarate dehydrogenase E2 component (dihydrolipoamide succinyltransferase)
MNTEIKMPQLGESVTEGTIGRWLKQPGEPIARFEPLVEVLTDKVDTEVPSPIEGTLLEICIPAGETVPVGTVLALIGEAGEQAAEGREQEAGHRRQGAMLPSAVQGEGVVASVAGAQPKGFISPVVARLVAEHGLDLQQITGSGAGGRITKQDVLQCIETRAVAVETVAEADSRTVTIEPDTELVPLTPMRRAIAEHMLRSIRIAPHVTTVFEVDLSQIVAHRAANKASFEQQGVRLTFTPYFFQAVAVALSKVPVLNGSFTEQGIMFNRRIHIGMAVALEEGLIVPVIRDVNEKNLFGIARAVNDLAERARTRRLKPDEAQGGTFTITNHGVSGSLIATPIINQPQAAILGIGAIIKRPVVVSHVGNDALAIKPMCYLALTFDHRIADGATGDAFLAVVKAELEGEWVSG